MRYITKKELQDVNPSFVVEHEPSQEPIISEDVMHDLYIMCSIPCSPSTKDRPRITIAWERGTA
jgi:hypothetical protein